MKLNKSQKRMVGVLLPPELYNYFSLVCLAESKSKTSVAEGIIESFYKSNSKKCPESSLLERIKASIELEWRTSKCKTVAWREYETEMHLLLSGEGLTNTQIKKILEFEH